MIKMIQRPKHHHIKTKKNRNDSKVKKKTKNDSKTKKYKNRKNGNR